MTCVHNIYGIYIYTDSRLKLTAGLVEHYHGCNIFHFPLTPPEHGICYLIECMGNYQIIRIEVLLNPSQSVPVLGRDIDQGDVPVRVGNVLMLCIWSALRYRDRTPRESLLLFLSTE